jgi:hypothetical protein
MNSKDPLQRIIQAWTTRSAPVGIAALADAARKRHAGVAAVLFYGSCLRSGRADEGIADLYLLVDDYRVAFDSGFKAVMNCLLPPNVFYLETPWEGRTLRAKYAVLTLNDFEKGARSWFHSYIWGRFAQPSGLIYTRDRDASDRVHQALTWSVRTFVRRALPQAPDIFTARELWSTGLSLSYRCELRSEGPDTAARLVDAAPDYYTAVTRDALGDPRLPVEPLPGSPPLRYRLNASSAQKRRNHFAWRLRQMQGKCLSALRLLKALLTFENGLDYALWKIERHSNVRVEVSPLLRRIPPLAVLVIFWKLFRKGAFR